MPVHGGQVTIQVVLEQELLHERPALSLQNEQVPGCRDRQKRRRGHRQARNARARLGRLPTGDYVEDSDLQKRQHQADRTFHQDRQAERGERQGEPAGRATPYRVHQVRAQTEREREGQQCVGDGRPPEDGEAQGGRKDQGGRRAGRRPEESRAQEGDHRAGRDRGDGGGKPHRELVLSQNLLAGGLDPE